MSLRTEEDRRRIAQENIERANAQDDWAYWSRETLKQQALAATKWLGRDEEKWEELIPLLVEIEYGRLTAIQMERETPEYQKAFAEYLQNR